MHEGAERRGRSQTNLTFAARPHTDRRVVNSLQRAKSGEHALSGTAGMEGPS